MTVVDVSSPLPSEILYEGGISQARTRSLLHEVPYSPISQVPA